MLVIRLRRKGKKNQPFFRVIVIDKRKTAKGGNAVEILGNIDPLTKKSNLKKDRILYWISKGAQPSATVHNLLVSKKIIEAKKIKVDKPAKSSASAEQSGGPVTIPGPEGTPADLVGKPEAAPVETPKEEVKPEEKPAA